jgi:hypothetical protein
MPDQTPLKKSAVVGEDGELIQPDMTVDPEAYSEFVATYVRRDPLLFRINSFIREHQFIFLFLIFDSLFMAITLIDDLFSHPERMGTDFLGIVMINLVIGIAARIVYVILRTDTRP